MTIVFLHQLHDHLISLRVQLSMIVVLLFFVVNGTMYSWRMETQAQVDSQLTADLSRRLDGIETIRDAVGAGLRVANQPTGTGFIVESGFDRMWGSLWFGAETGRIPFRWFARDVNFWMSRFENTDWTLIVRLVLSFLCIMLAYDGISGEAQRGTLRQVFANPISRGRVLVGKFAAHLAVLLVATLLGTVVSLLIQTMHGAVELNGALLWAHLLFLVATVVYLSLFLFITLGISALTRTSASSLVLLTMTWAVFIVVIPQCSFLIAMQAVEHEEGWMFKSYDVMNEARETLTKGGLALRDSSLAGQDGFAVERQVAQRIEEVEKEQMQVRRHGFAQQLQRYEVARAVNLLSPGFAFQYTIGAMLKTGVAKRESFFRQALEHRLVVREFVGHRDAADPDSPHVRYLPGYMSMKPLDGDEIPRFQEKPLSFAESFAAGVMPLTILVFEALGAMLFALWRSTAPTSRDTPLPRTEGVDGS